MVNEWAILPINFMIIKNTILVTIIRVFGLAAQFLLFAYVARTLAIEEVGNYVVMTTIWSVWRVVGAFGYDSVIMKYGKSEESEFSVLYKKINKKTNDYNLGILLLMLIVFLVINFYKKEIKFNNFLIAIFGCWMQTKIALCVAKERVVGNLYISQVPESIILNIIIFSIIITAQYFININVDFVFISHLVSYALIYLFYISIDKNTKNIDKNNIPTEAIILAKSAMKGMIAAVIALRFPILLLPFFASSADVAIFEVALKIGFVGTIPIWAVGIVIGPMLVNIKKDDIICLRATFLQVFFAALFLMGFIFFGEIFISEYFGDSYSKAYPIAIIISIGTTINAIGGVASQYMLMNNGEKIVERYSMWAAFFTLIGSPLAVIFSGGIGLAWVFVIRSLIRDIGLSFFLYGGIYAGKFKK
jgi:O-antigen/teichoic acid export membrane protein